MSHIINNATAEDLPLIYRLFEEAIQYQKDNGFIGWQNYDKAFLQEDVRSKFLFRIISDDAIIGIFSICYVDALIWREKEKGDAIYLHRIVLNRRFKGEKIFSKVFGWAKEQAAQQGLKYIRMDTWAGNAGIIDYYKSYGFRFVENYTTPDTEDLPVQHRALNVALLEFAI